MFSFDHKEIRRTTTEPRARVTTKKKTRAIDNVERWRTKRQITTTDGDKKITLRLSFGSLSFGARVLPSLAASQLQSL
jgi:hypothetical protein